MVLAGGLIAAACGSGTPSAAKKTSHNSSSNTTTTTAAPSSTTTTAAGSTTPTTAAAKTTSGTAAAASTTPATTKTVTTTAPTAPPSANNALGGANDFNTPAASLTGAGSTFDQPLFARQFYDYNKANSKVSVNYAAVGSGTGESDILAGSVNFGASDVPEPAGTTGQRRRHPAGARRPRWHRHGLQRALPGGPHPADRNPDRPDLRRQDHRLEQDRLQLRRRLEHRAGVPGRLERDVQRLHPLHDRGGRGRLAGGQRRQDVGGLGRRAGRQRQRRRGR